MFCFCASACADAIQIRPHRLKSHCLGSKISQNKGSKFKKMGERVTFLTLPESVVLTGVGVGKFSSTLTPDQSQSQLRDFFITSFLVKMETKMKTEHYLHTADSLFLAFCCIRCSYRWGCVCFRVN